MTNISLMNHEGEGFSQAREVEDGTTIQDFFAQQMGEQGVKYVNEYAIRVNREPVEASYVLQENDRITITPTKIRGA